MSVNYFISYHINIANGWAFGMCECQVSKSMDTFADIKNVADDIQKRTPGCTGVIILNWREIDFPKPQKPAGGEGGT